MEPFDGFFRKMVLEMAARYFERNGCGTSTGDRRWIYMSKLQQTKNFEKRDDMTIMVLGIWDRYLKESAKNDKVNYMNKVKEFYQRKKF